ncbi:MAG: precorrin-6A reductase [Clostridia bacterium]|jgi:precorrin-6A/cobalt-precorrin-6A reductase|nr:precorrin-6A reductase [Clostridia bacterium]
MILVLGGTEDSREIATELTNQGYQVTISVVTEYGQELAIETGASRVLSGPLDESKFTEIIKQNSINTVVDATHPFAAYITGMAYKICNLLDIDYIRYERKTTNYLSHQLIKTAATFPLGLEIAASLPGPWLFTTGSKQLREIIEAKVFSIDQLYLRVLPDPDVLANCFKLGLRARNIIAMQGPFSYELNRAMFQDLGIRTVITKDSGTVGGTLEKIKAGLELELNVIIIARPLIGLPKNIIVQTIPALIQFLRRFK